MKKFSKSINLTCWQTIKDRYAHSIGNIGIKRSEHLDKSEIPYLENLLASDLTNFSGLSHSLRNAMLFYSGPGDNRGIHIDYFNNWNNYPTWALNIPIVNGDRCEMQWFGGDYTKEVKTVNAGSPAWHLTWKSAPVLLESEIIDKPTVVFVDMPHNVINHSSNPRVVLSLRFGPSLAQDTPEPISL